jgi:hypothetical protein
MRSAGSGRKPPPFRFDVGYEPHLRLFRIPALRRRSAGDARSAHNAPNLWLTTRIRHKGAIARHHNSVRLGSARARPTTNLHTCRIDDVVAYAPRFEQTVEPEAVIARLVARTSILQQRAS